MQTVKKPRKGICAYASEYIGQAAIIYEDLGHGKVGELIGIYEIYDTGYGRPTEVLNSNGKPRGTIQIGATIDIFAESDSDGKELIKEHGNRVLVQIVDAKG